MVSKLLTGFDAPSCTYIYLDNELHDHNLFQAICRTNRLDGDDKDYGYIVDFKELFEDVQDAIAVYSSDELDIDEGGGGTNNVELKDWLKEGKKQLDAAREALRYLCEPVPPPREMEQYPPLLLRRRQRTPTRSTDTEPLRISFYKAVATFVRAYADIAQNLTEAGYSDAEAAALQKEVEFYSDTRAAIKKHSGEELDIKPYEADMRHLLNTYVQADPAADLGNLNSLSLTELIIETGIHDAIARKLNEKGKLSKNAIAEGIINNVRKTIIRDQLTDPRFYAEMSKLLDDLIKQSRADTAAYEAVPEEGGGTGEAHGAEGAAGGVSCGAARQTRGHRALQQPGQHPGDDLSVPCGRRREGDARPRNRPGHAREGSGRMERRRHPREAGAQCALPASCRGTGRRRRPSSRSSRTSRATDDRDDPTRRDFDSGDAEGHQECPPLRSSADGRVTLVAPTATRLDVARAYAISKLGWIREQQCETSRTKPAKRPGKFVERESHYLWGRRYLLTVVHRDAKPFVSLDHKRITLTVRPGSDASKARRGDSRVA